jgi:hypothetical protein
MEQMGELSRWCGGGIHTLLYAMLDVEEAVGAHASTKHEKTALPAALADLKYDSAGDR